MTLNLGSQRMNWQNTEGFQDTETTLYDSIMLLLFSQSVVSDSVTPRTSARQASQSFSVSRRLLNLMSIESVMTFNHLSLCHPLLLSSIFPSISVFSNELALRMRWPKYWSFSFIPSKEIPGLIFRVDWLDLLAVQRTLKSLLQLNRLTLSKR